MFEFPTVFAVILAAYAVVLVVGAGLLIAVAADALVAQRRVRVSRGSSIATHYFGLTPSH